ncbi:MAG: zinc-binding alcohol dehydrogenase family protein [Ktedonobacteraceae bacterium]
MKVAMLRAIGQPLIVEDIPEPVPGAGEVLVRVLATPVLAYTQEVITGKRDNHLVLPLVPGSGAIGLVEKAGPDATRLIPGQLVFCDSTIRSRDDGVTPDIMLQGWAAHGEGAQKLQTHFRNGSFAEKVIVPLENAVVLDHMDGIAPAQLTWLSTWLVPYGGWLAANIQPGQVVMVNGATGHFGSAGVAVAIAMGVERVVALGRNQGRLDALVNYLGERVRPVLLSDDEALNRKRIAQAAAGPIDCMLDLLSPIREGAPTLRGILAVRRGGTAVLMGGVDADIALPYRYVMHNNLVIRGQWMYPRHAPLLLAGLIRAGLLRLEGFSTHTFPLEEVGKAIQYAYDHGGAFQMTVLTP